MRQKIKKLQYVKTWQLVILFIFACFIAATFLRLNNIGMIERRNAVLSADKAGDPKIIRDRLYDLQNYVSSHMNTNMDKGIALEASYRRDTQASYEKASNDKNPNGNIYKKVQDVCAPQFTHWSYAYIQCTVNELAKYPAGSNLINSVDLPDASMYVHSFASPLWSADFAGWSVVLCVVILIMIIARITSVIILKLLLRHHKNAI